MSVPKPDASQNFFSIAQDLIAQRKVPKEETKNKQIYYDDKVKKFEEKLAIMSYQEKQDPEQLWSSISNLANFCNSAGDYFLKIGYSDLALPYLEKARNLLELITRDGIKNKREWKILKVQVMRNLSLYYNDKGNEKKAASCLREIFGLQGDLEKEDVVLPGFEFVYIKLAYYSMKEKNWDETCNFAGHAIAFLEKILKIKKGIPILENKPVSEDKDFLLVYSKKLVTLSYAYFMLAKALMKKSNFIDAITYIEKAYQIASKYLGKDDKVTLNYKNKLDATLNKLKTNVPKVPELNYIGQQMNTEPQLPISNTNTSKKNTNRLAIDVSKANFKGFNLLSDFMNVSPSIREQTKSVSYRESIPSSQFARTEKLKSPKEGRIASQFSQMAPLSTKYASTITQNPVESTLEKDDLFIFEARKVPFNSLFPTPTTSNINSRTVLSPSASIIKDNEVKFTKKHRPKGSISFSNKESDIKAKNPFTDSVNKGNTENNAFNIELDNEFNIEASNTNLARITFRPESAMDGDPYALRMNQRPLSSKKPPVQSTKTSFDIFGPPIKSATIKPQKPDTVVSNRISVRKVNHRPLSAAVKQTRLVPRTHGESVNKFNGQSQHRSPTKSKSRSRSPSLTFDNEQDMQIIDKDKLSDPFMMEWESSIETYRSGTQEAPNAKEIASSPPKKPGKISQELVNMLKMEAKNFKYENDIFKKPEEKGPHITEQGEEMKEEANLLENNKVEPDDKNSPNKVEPIKNTPKMIAKELLIMKSVRTVKDLAQLRQLEEEAARTIQQVFKRIRRQKIKLSTTNANIEENMPMSTNELNSVQNIHGRHGDSLLDVNLDNYPSHNNLETISSAKPSKVLRKSFLLKGLSDTDNKIILEELFKFRDDQCHEYIQRRKAKKEDEDEFMGNRSLNLDDKFMLPKTEEELVPKLEVIKRNLNNLKDYEISFYGRFFEDSGMWTLKYGGLREKKDKKDKKDSKDSQYLVFYLCHGRINHPLKFKADLKVTEKAMFFSTIWRVISANLNAYLTKEELMNQQRKKQERLFLIINDLKKEEKMNPILKITQMELESLREMLIKLCFILEDKFILYKKPTGYVYEWTRRIENSQGATRSRRYLGLSKVKLQKQIRKLATLYNPFNYLPERGQYPVKLNNHSDVYFRQLSGGSLRKSIGTLPNGSDSEREDDGYPYRIQTGQLKDVNEITKKKSIRRSIKKMPSSQRSAINQKQGVFLQTEIQPKAEDIMAFQEHYKNPFILNQILFQNLLRIEKHFLLASLRILFSKNAADEISDETQLEFSIEVELFGGNKWRDQIKLPYRDFMDKVRQVKLTLKDFTINSGFLAKQRRLLSDFFLHYVTIVDSRIQIRNPYHETRSQMMGLDNKELFKTKSPFLSDLGRPKTMRGFMQALQKIHSLWEDEHIEYKQVRSLARAQIKVLSVHDPNFGGSERIMPKFDITDQTRMQYYNSYKYIKPRRYYIAFSQKQDHIMMRVDYIEKGADALLSIKLYHFCTGAVDYIAIKEKKTQERLLNIMQMTSEEMKRKSLKDIFEFQKSLIGNKLLLNEKLKLGRYNKKFDITPMNISQILMTQGDENLPKYRLDLQKHFTKGVINNLGNCYITITTYFINNLYKFDNIFCIKFEIMPFNSKTKFYKFLINSKDIKLYLNKDYPKENPYDNWDTIHFIIKSLILKRHYVYSSIELPIKDTKFILMKYQKYNLKNVVSQSIESSSIGAKVIFGNFLQPKIQETQVILQITKRVQGKYVIITIEKHTILDHWSFIVYDPKTCRKYVTSIYFSDICALNGNFIERLYSSAAAKVDNDKRSRADYSRFTKSYIEAVGESQVSLSRAKKKTSRKDESRKEDIGSILFDEKSKTNLGTKDKDKEQKMTEQAKRNFYEIKFWENVVKYLDFSYTKSGNILLILDNFRGVMREFIYREILQTSKNEESLVEIFLENNYQRYTMFQTINHISLPYIQNHDLFVRVTRLEKMTIYNNRFNLKQVIELYEQEKLRDKIALLKGNKIVFSQIKVLSQYMTYKIKMWNMVMLSEDQLANQSINKEGILPWTSYKLKLNCNFETITKIDHQRLFIDQQLIYRGILTVEPLQMVSLVYDENKGTIRAYLYDVKESWLLKKSIKMRDIIANIPYVKVMLKQKLNYEVGKRVYEALKNSLIVYSFMKKKKIV